jgi:orotidine-5'-phosphate decarboxylase
LLVKGLPAIIDAKVNEISTTARWISKYYFDAGFDAITCNPFVGYEGGLDAVFTEAKKRDRGVILVTLMAHPGSRYGFQRLAIGKEAEQPFYKMFAQAAKDWKADAVMVGATFPHLLPNVRKRVGQDILILSAGIGIQGGAVEDAIRNGTDFCIVGRSIVHSPDPLAEVRGYNARINKALETQPQIV